MRSPYFGRGYPAIPVYPNVPMMSHYWCDTTGLNPKNHHVSWVNRRSLILNHLFVGHGSHGKLLPESDTFWGGKTDHISWYSTRLHDITILLIYGYWCSLYILCIVDSFGEPKRNQSLKSPLLWMVVHHSWMVDCGVGLLVSLVSRSHVWDRPWPHELIFGCEFYESHPWYIIHMLHTCVSKLRSIPYNPMGIFHESNQGYNPCTMHGMPLQFYVCLQSLKSLNHGANNW